MNEGVVLKLNTITLLNFVELENLGSEELLEIKAKLGVWEIYAQIKDFMLDEKFCKFKLVRILILNKLEDNEGNKQHDSAFDMQDTVVLGTDIHEELK